MNSLLLRFLLGLVLVSYAITTPMPVAAFSTVAARDGQEKVAKDNSPQKGTSDTVVKACGEYEAKDLVEQQSKPDYEHEATFIIKDFSNVEKARQCVLAARAWVEKLDQPKPIKLLIYPHDPDITADFLSEKNGFGFSEKISFDIRVVVPISSRSLIKLFGALNKNEGIKFFHSFSTSIGEEGAKALAEILKENNALETLFLQSNEIGPEGAIALVNALKGHKALRSLILADNSIGFESVEFVKAVAEMLKQNEVIQTLSLVGVYFGNEGAKVLARAVVENKSLKKLDLPGNSIGDEGAYAFVEALAENSELEEVSLRHNSISGQAKQALKAVAKKKGIRIKLEYYEF